METTEITTTPVTTTATTTGSTTPTTTRTTTSTTEETTTTTTSTTTTSPTTTTTMTTPARTLPSTTTTAPTTTSTHSATTAGPISSPSGSTTLATNILATRDSGSICDRPVLGLPSTIENPLTYLKSKLIIINAKISMSCSVATQAAFQWSVTNTDTQTPVEKPPNVVWSSTHLEFPSGYLDYGEYQAELKVWPIEMETFFSEEQRLIIIEASELMATIVGGSNATAGSAFVLDGSASRDPDVTEEASGLTYQWSAETVGGSNGENNACDGQIQDNPALYSAQTQAGTECLFTLTVSKDTRIATATKYINTLPLDRPTLAIRCVGDFCGRECIPSHFAFKIMVTCSTSCQEYQWSIYQNINGQREKLDLDFYQLSDEDSSLLVLADKALRPGVIYIFVVFVLDAFAEQDIMMCSAPSGGRCSTNQQKGLAVKDQFTLTCSNWMLGEQAPPGDAEITYAAKAIIAGEGYLVSEVRGLDGVSLGPFLLPEGEEDNDYEVEIVIDINTDFGSQHTERMIFMVAPNAEIDLKALNEEIKEAASLNDHVTATWMTYLVNRYTQQIEDDMVDILIQIVKEPLSIASAESSINILGDVMVKLTSGKKEDILNSLPETMENSAKVMAKFKSSSKVQGVVTGGLSGVARAWESMRCNDIVTEADLYDPSPQQWEEEKARVAAANDKKSEECRKVGASGLKVIEHSPELTAASLLPGEEFATPKGDLFLKVRKVWVKSLGTAPVVGPDIGSVEIPLSLKDEAGIQQGEPVTSTIMSINKKLNMFSGPANSDAIGFSVGDQNGQQLTVKDTKDPIKINIKIPLEEMQVTRIPCSGNRLVNLTKVDNLVMVTDKGCDFTIEDDGGFYTAEQYTASEKERKQLNLIGDVNMLVLKSEGTEDRQLNISFSSGQLYSSNSDSSSRESVNTTWVLAVFQCHYEEQGIWKAIAASPVLPNLMEGQCLSDHLTLFSSSWIVPPNSIDFSTVFQNLDQKILENIHVIITVGGLTLIYLLLAICLRRKDKEDRKKWAVAVLSDNLPRDKYHYHLTIHTGTRTGAETESSVFFVVVGETGETEVRKLHSYTKKSLGRGSVNQYLLSVPSCLGPLIYVRVWHDNKGSGARGSWFLDRIAVKDLQTQEKFVFLCNRWLAVDRDDGQIERLLPVATAEDLKKFHFLFQATTRKDMTDEHLWFSLMSRPTQSRFTRVQRLSCCLALLFASMIANAMWYRTDDDIKGKQYVRIGPLEFTPQQLFISIASSLVSIPPTVLIVFLFRRSGRRPPKIKSTKTKKREADRQEDLTASSVSLSNKTINSNEKCQSWLWQYDNSKTKGVMPWMNKRGNTEITELDNVAQERRVSFDGIDFTPKEEMEKTPTPIPVPSTSRTRKQHTTRMLPWWCVYVAWCLVFLLVATSGFFTILYSFEWGREKSLSWLISFLFSFFESILLVQPIKVILLAMMVTLICKRPPDEESDFTYDDVIECTKQLPPLDKEKEHDTYSHRVPYRENAVNPDQLGRMREEREKKLRMFAIFKEISVYMVYLILICVLTYDSRDPNSYMSKHEISNILNAAKFVKAKTQGDVFAWTKDTLIPNLYAETWYNSQEVKWRLKNFLSNLYYFRIGSPRMRLARVKPAKCKMAGIVHTLRSAVDGCYNDYGLNSYDENDYGPGWEELASVANDTRIYPWKYQSTLNLDGAPIWGLLEVYGGGGYVAELGTDRDAASAVVLDLESQGWLDRASRALFIEFNIYNPFTNLFSMVTFISEMPPTGGNVNHALIKTIQMYSYVGTRALFLVLLQVAFVAFTLYHIYAMVKGWKKEGRRWFSSKWNILEMSCVLTAVMTCIMFGIRLIMLRYTLNKFQKHRGSYVNFAYVIYWDELYSYMLGCLVFLAMLKLLRLLKFNQKVTELISTLQVSVKPLMNFMLLFLIIYLAFAQLGYLVFGKHLLDYSSLISSMESMFSMMLMKFSFHELTSAHPAVGPVFFLLFILVLVFVVMNMLLTILNESYYTVQSQRLMTSNDYEMVDYMMEQLKGVIGMGAVFSTSMESGGGNKENGKELFAKMTDKQKMSEILRTEEDRNGKY